jgi:hypothetical protein
LPRSRNLEIKSMQICRQIVHGKAEAIPPRFEEVKAVEMATVKGKEVPQDAANIAPSGQTQTSFPAHIAAAKAATKVVGALMLPRIAVNGTGM